MAHSPNAVDDPLLYRRHQAPEPVWIEAKGEHVRPPRNPDCVAQIALFVHDDRPRVMIDERPGDAAPIANVAFEEPLAPARAGHVDPIGCSVDRLAPVLSARLHLTVDAHVECQRDDPVRCGRQRDGVAGRGGGPLE